MSASYFFPRHFPPLHLKLQQSALASQDSPFCFRVQSPCRQVRELGSQKRSSQQLCLPFLAGSQASPCALHARFGFFSVQSWVFLLQRKPLQHGNPSWHFSPVLVQFCPDTTQRASARTVSTISILISTMMSLKRRSKSWKSNFNTTNTTNSCWW